MKDETEKVYVGILDRLRGKEVMLLKTNSSMVFLGEILFCIDHLFRGEVLDNEI